MNIRFLRSEENVDGGMAAPVPAMWELTLGWYSDRLDPTWSPPTVHHLQGLLDAVGLTDPFWRLT